jgi:hypothetical protein
MASEALNSWEPPAGMLPAVVTAWRAFYGAAWRNYGVTPQFYRALYLAQKGRCYICQKAKGVNPDDPKGKGGRRLGVDHNHAIGNRIEAVRGLLCTGGDRTCNRVIGWLGHQALVRAVQYVERPPAQRLMADWPLLTDEQLTGWLTR